MRTINDTEIRGALNEMKSHIAEQAGQKPNLNSLKAAVGKAVSGINPSSLSLTERRGWYYITGKLFPVKGLDLWFEQPIDFEVRVDHTSKTEGVFGLMDFKISYSHPSGGTNGNTNSNLMVIVEAGGKVNVFKNRRDADKLIGKYW